jgi:hypothetical protein
MPASASAETAHAGWEIVPGVYPTHLVPGASGYIMLSIQNVGGADSNGTITVTDKLPDGVEASEAGYRGYPIDIEFDPSAEEG